jgi:hypothetical protein
MALVNDSVTDCSYLVKPLAALVEKGRLAAFPSSKAIGHGTVGVG